MAETVERMIALEGAVNFRDLGGYAASAGTRTRWRTLFRADGLGELTEADLSVLDTLGIRTVIDLRSGTELERGRFDVDAHPVAFHHFPFIDELPDAQEFDRRPGLLGSQYLEMVRDAGGQILASLEVLATPDALPAVFHCTAGKDRTGVLSAIVLSLLGVDEPTVVADYALSGAAMQRLRAKLLVKYPEGRETIREHRRGLLGRPGPDGAAARPRAGPVRLGQRLRRWARRRTGPRRGPAGAPCSSRPSSPRRRPGRPGANGRPRRPGPGRGA